MIKGKRGFTLIELLVVIAIISLLSSVIFSVTNSARDKGSDAKIKSVLVSARTQADIFHNINGTYASACGISTVESIYNLFFEAHNASGATSWTNNPLGAGSSTKSACHARSADWAISVPLKTNNENSWCVDSTGQSLMLIGAHLGGTGSPRQFKCVQP